MTYLLQLGRRRQKKKLLVMTTSNCTELQTDDLPVAVGEMTTEEEAVGDDY